MSGTIASTRSSIAEVAVWMPPAYDPPIMPTTGSPAASVAMGWAAVTQSMRALTSRPSTSGSLMRTSPPEHPNPRWSQVSTA